VERVVLDGSVSPGCEACHRKVGGAAEQPGAPDERALRSKLARSQVIRVSGRRRRK
jgi:hypothetical protein